MQAKVVFRYDLVFGLSEAHHVKTKVWETLGWLHGHHGHLMFSVQPVVSRPSKNEWVNMVNPIYPLLQEIDANMTSLQLGCAVSAAIELDVEPRDVTIFFKDIVRILRISGTLN